MRTLVYNEKGQVSWIERGGNAIDNGFGYDPAGRLNMHRLHDVQLSSQVQWDFARNPASQIISETRDNDLYAWTGHANVDRAYAVNGLNQYAAVGADGYCYDANWQSHRRWHLHLSLRR